MSKFVLIKRKVLEVLAILLILSGNSFEISAHGGEDHGETKAKTETTDKGTVARSARLGELEVMFKHPLLLPDQPTAGRLFLTKFQTNEPFTEVSAEMEIESANNFITPVTVEKTATSGVFTVKIPALSAGNYTVRTKLTHNGETDTATFSDVEIKNQPLPTDEGGMSWSRTLLISFVFSIVLALFGVLFYFVLRVDSPKKTVSV